MVKTALLYLKNYRNGNILKIVSKLKKNISPIEKVSRTKTIFFRPLNFQKDRFNNKKVFLEGGRSPLEK